MVFSSIPSYLDPSNWQQQPNHDQSGGGGGASSPQQLNQLVPFAQPVPPPQPPPTQSYMNGGGGCVGGSIRPGSMAERARLANVPMPEAPLKCPRCESTNTKFCYFNNYSLTQPRHFCKTCRRYWTRGGALRSVPVGGGCRRNKRSKGGGGAASSKSPANSSDRQTTCSSTSTVSSNNNTGSGNLLGLMAPQIPALRFLSPLGQLTDHYNSSSEDMSLSYSNALSSSLVGPCETNFQSNLLTGINGGGLGLGSIEQWRFPFFDSSPAMGFQEPLSFIGERGHNERLHEVSNSLLTQMASVKMEENQGLNLSRQISGNDPWNINTTASAWTDFTTFTSSSTSNPL